MMGYTTKITYSRSVRRVGGRYASVPGLPGKMWMEVWMCGVSSLNLGMFWSFREVGEFGKMHAHCKIHLHHT